MHNWPGQIFKQVSSWLRRKYPTYTRVLMIIWPRPKIRNIGMSELKNLPVSLVVPVSAFPVWIWLGTVPYPLREELWGGSGRISIIRISRIISPFLNLFGFWNIFVIVYPSTFLGMSSHDLPKPINFLDNSSENLVHIVSWFLGFYSQQIFVFNKIAWQLWKWKMEKHFKVTGCKSHANFHLS